MSCQRLCQKAFKHNRLAVAFSVMFAWHSPLLLADEHAQGSHSQGISDSNTVAPVSGSQNASSQKSSSQNLGTKVMSFKMQENQMHFPEWPVKQVVVKDVPPPPPLGPYMSTALNNEQTGKPHFQSMISIPVPEFEETPMTTFSPDLPWPGDNGASVNRWTPDKGYTFVGPNGRSPQSSFGQVSNQQANKGNTRRNGVNPQRQQNYYSHPPMPASSMYNKAMNSRPMYNGPVMRGAARPNSGANYFAPANQNPLRRNPSMQARHLPANYNYGQNNGMGSARYNVNPYSNGMGQPPRVNTGYNRSAYGVTRPPQMMPSSGNHR